MTLQAVPIRYRILAVLFVLSFVNYLLRNNLSVAMPSIRQEFDFTSAQLGWILGSFNFAYALFQIPGGIFGEVSGPRRALALLALSWGILTLFTGLAPALLGASATGAMVSLIAVRFLIGVTNAPLFPTTAGAFANWFPAGSWAFPNAVLSVGLTLGQAAIGPLVTFLIIRYGWRESFYALAPLGLLIGGWWYWYGRDKPAEHRAITAEELALITGSRPPAVAHVAPSPSPATSLSPSPVPSPSPSPATSTSTSAPPATSTSTSAPPATSTSTAPAPSPAPSPSPVPSPSPSPSRAWRTVLVQRNVLLLAAAYFCMNYVFYMFAQWLFTYLVESRGLSLLESGWLYMLPFATGALLAAAGGLTCDALCRRIGPRWGCRLPAMSGLVLVAVFLLAGANAANPYVAVLVLSLCFGFTQFTEGAFWSASTYVAGPHTATATGVMNTGGNAAGFLAPVVGMMVDQWGWLATFTSGSLFALVGAVLWLLIDIREVPGRV